MLLAEAMSTAGVAHRSRRANGLCVQPTDLPDTTLDALVCAYDAILFDAYGVLVDGRGPIEGAPEAIGSLNARGVPYLVLTNDASRLPSTMRARFVSFGIDIPEARIFSSGALLTPYFSAQNLVGARCVVLGPPDAAEYARRAGAEIVLPSLDAPADVLVVSDDAGYPFLETIDETLSMLFRAIDSGRAPRLILTNPDLIFPAGSGRFGITAGSVAVLFEAALAQRYPNTPGLTFERLGKPYAPLFEASLAHLGTRRAVMIGDQLATDIAGANAVSIDSALFVSGTVPLAQATRTSARPTWLLHSLALDT